ncbi:MAG: hypothetical protein M0R77_02440 [Gammaproteobacteria bacterium]|nr:hypothetical protein [Gammaproteobacteria bacterium]
MKIGNIKQQGDISTRNGSDSSNPESPNGESFNITTGSSTTDSGGSINLIVGSGSSGIYDGSINLKSVGSSTPARMRFYDTDESNFISFAAPDTITSNIQLTWPSSPGSTGQFLYLLSAGTFGWSSAVTSIAASQPAAGLTISGSPIISSGTLTFALANDLAALEGLSGTGLARRTGTDTWTLDTNTYLTSSTGVTTFSGGTTGLTPTSATSGIITLGGTLNVANGGTGRSSVTANNLLVGNGTNALNLIAPSGTNTKLRWSGSAYSWSADTLSSLTDTNISSPSSNQLLTWNGSAWVNQTWASAATSYSTTISSWTLVSGNLYSAVVAHNLNTRNVGVTLYDTANNTIIFPDKIVLTSANSLTITVTGNTHTINVTVLANGQTMAPSANVVGIQSNGVDIGGTYNSINFAGTNVSAVNSGSNLATVTINTTTSYRNAFSAASFESPNNSDWPVNLLAPVINDPSRNSLLVRSFATGSENGVGFYSTIPTGSTTIAFHIKGRAATAPGSPSTVVLRLYSRAIPNNAAVGSWSAATTLTTLTIPTNAFYQYTTVSVSLASLGLTAGTFYEFELTRNGGTLSSSAWYLAELITEIS